MFDLRKIFDFRKIFAVPKDFLKSKIYCSRWRSEFGFEVEAFAAGKNL